MFSVSLFRECPCFSDQVSVSRWPRSGHWGDTGQRREAGTGRGDRKQCPQETEEEIKDFRWEEEQDKTGDEEDN